MEQPLPYRGVWVCVFYRILLILNRMLFYFVPYSLVLTVQYVWFLLLLQTLPPCQSKADRTITSPWTRHLPSVTLHRNRLARWLRLSCDLAISSRTTHLVRCQPCSTNCLQQTTTAVHCEDLWWQSLWLAFQTLVLMRVWKDQNLFKFRNVLF